MKFLNATKLMFICFSLLLFSCQHDQDQELEQENITNEAVNLEEIDLATFNFANGNTLTISKGYEDLDPYLASLESGSNDNKISIDIENNSLLKIYLSLTPEGTPIPQALLDLSDPNEKAGVTSSRKTIEKLDNPVFYIEKYPSELVEKSLEKTKALTFCETVGRQAAQCINSSYSSLRFASKNPCSKIIMYTEVFHDSGNNVSAHLWVGRGMRQQKKHTIKPGYWAKRSKKGLRRKRGNYRFATHGAHWRGFTRTYL